MANRQVKKLPIARLKALYRWPSEELLPEDNSYHQSIPWKSNDEKQEQEDRNQILICSIKGRFIVM